MFSVGHLERADIPEGAYTFYINDTTELTANSRATAQRFEAHVLTSPLP